MRPDGYQRMAAQRREPVPVHEQPVGQPPAFQGGAAGQIGDRLEQLRLRPLAQQPVDLVERRRLFLRRACVEPQSSAGDREFDRLQAADRLLQLQPPQPRGALDEAGGAKDREWRSVRLHHRQCDLESVAIAVVECRHGEGLAPRIGDPPARLVERHQFETLAADDPQGEIEKFRRDLQVSIGRVAARRRPRGHELDERSKRRRVRALRSWPVGAIRWREIRRSRR